MKSRSKTFLKASLANLTTMFIVLFSLVPTVGAQGGGADPVPGGGADPQPFGLGNWLANAGIETIPDLIQKLLEIVFIIGVPVVALAIIWAGFQFVWAQGDPTKLQKAREVLLWTIVGAALVLGSKVIATAIGGTITELVG